MYAEVSFLSQVLIEPSLADDCLAPLTPHVGSPSATQSAVRSHMQGQEERLGLSRTVQTVLVFEQEKTEEATKDKLWLTGYTCAAVDVQRSKSRPPTLGRKC